jgi:hypothetical protein
MAKGLTLSFRGAQLEELTAYAERGGMTLQDAIRELVSLGLSVAPQDTITQNARQRAYDDTRRYVHAKFAESLTNLSRDMEKTIGLEIWGATTPKHGG